MNLLIRCSSLIRSRSVVSEISLLSSSIGSTGDTTKNVFISSVIVDVFRMCKIMLNKRKKKYSIARIVTVNNF